MSEVRCLTAKGIRYDKRCYFKVRSKGDIPVSRFNLPQGESVESVLDKKKKLRWDGFPEEEGCEPGMKE